jgi:hypothetical protein
MKNNMNAFIPLNNTTVYKLQEYNLEVKMKNKELTPKNEGILCPHKFPITHKSQRHLIPSNKIVSYFNLLHKSLFDWQTHGDHFIFKD